MNRNVAVSTENDQVFIFIVSVVADRTLGVFLHHESPLVRRELHVPPVICHLTTIILLIFAPLLELQQYPAIVQIIFLLLPQLNVTQKVDLKSRRIVHI